MIITDDFGALGCKRGLQFSGCLAAVGFLCDKEGKTNADRLIYLIRC